MNIFLNSLVKYQKLFIRNSKFCVIKNPVFDIKALKYSSVNDDDLFGVGSKYADLDSASKNYKIEHPKKFDEKKGYKNQNEDEDKFGTLSNGIDEIELQTSVGYTKSINKSKSVKENQINDEENEVERKYDKVLNYRRLSSEFSRNTEQYYGHKINELANRGKIKEAIDVFFVEMIEKDRFKPTLWLYKTLMRHLAQKGYTHMVFELFKKITTSRDDDWDNGDHKTKLHQIITLLFQSCANSPWKEYSIRKCDSIRFYLKNRQITPNNKNYSAMILAYGKADAIYEAFNVVDEMLYKKVKIDADIINNLLCACISQPNYGFRYALMTWQMCIKLKIVPNSIMYNLMLKAANDCNIMEKKDRINIKLFDNKQRDYFQNEHQNLFPKNSIEFKNFSDEDYNYLMDDEKKNSTPKVDSTDLNQEISKLNKETLDRIGRDKSLIDQNSNNILQINKEDIQIIDNLTVVGKSLEKQIQNLEWWQDIKTNIDKKELLKGLTEFKPELKEVILAQSYESLLTRVHDNIEKEIFGFVTNELDTGEGHLQMLGGMDGVLKSMISHQAKPDNKTFALMLQAIPNNLEAEDEILSHMEKMNVKLDVNFINLLIKRRIKRSDFYGADEAFKMIQKNQLSPDIMTFGCLAFRINRYDLLVQFLNDLTEMNFKLNPIIISNLYSKGYQKKDIKFLSYLFDFIYDNNVKIDQKLKNKIDTDINEMKTKLIEFEKVNKLDDKDQEFYYKLKRFYNSFKKMYDGWIQVVKFEIKIHPYAKFARKDDKLYENFVAKTERYQKSEKI